MGEMKAVTLRAPRCQKIRIPGSHALPGILQFDIAKHPLVDRGPVRHYRL